MKRFWFVGLLGGVSLLLSHVAVYGQETLGFTQEDRERIIRLETTLTLFMEATDKRFEQVDKRFEQVDKRFEQVDKRIVELREDMNKRFEQVDKRFEQMMNTLQLIAGIFTVLTLGVIGFAYWDRRTIIRKAKQETLETLEREAAPKEEAIIGPGCSTSGARDQKRQSSARFDRCLTQIGRHRPTSGKRSQRISFIVVTHTTQGAILSCYVRPFQGHFVQFCTYN